VREQYLGKTGIRVTELVFGALPMGPLQKNIPFPEATKVVKRGLEQGIGFIDTAQNYRTYEPIAAAIKETGIHPVISTKSTASTYSEMENAVKEALNKLDVEVIDIFYLHAARVSGEVFSERAGAIECLQDYKAKGLIKAVGLATHSVEAVNQAVTLDEIDVVFPLLNIKGRGILGGSREEMMEAIRCNYNVGKGIVIMKALAGVHLIHEFQESIEFIREFGHYHCIAVGMVTPEEVDYNVAYFHGGLDPRITPPPATVRKRAYVVEGICVGCGRCLEGCHSGAISIKNGFSEGKKAYIDPESCLMCGYCTTHCPQFAIRVI